MVDEKVTPKRRGRGISNDTQAVNELHFHEKDNAGNGLFIGHLESVEVLSSVNADGKTFTGMKVPRLVFHFTSNHDNASERRHVRYTLRPVESNVDTIDKGKDAWKVNNVFKGIKHILDVLYLRGRVMTDAEIDALTLDFNDTDDDGNFVQVEPQVVLDGYQKIFENTAAMMNGTFNLAKDAVPHPCFKDANGKPISLWMKLLRYTKRGNKGWQPVGQNGELAFNQFIGNGLIEIQHPKESPKILSLDLSYESITPKETKKEPTLGGAAAAGVTAVNPTGLPAYAASNGVGDNLGQNGDMPF